MSNPPRTLRRTPSPPESAGSPTSLTSGYLQRLSHGPARQPGPLSQADGQRAGLTDAVALERAGAFAVVLESVPADLGRRVSGRLRIPTVGIGGGPDCDVQISDHGGARGGAAG